MQGKYSYMYIYLDNRTDRNSNSVKKRKHYTLGKKKLMTTFSLAYFRYVNIILFVCGLDKIISISPSMNFQEAKRHSLHGTC